MTHGSPGSDTRPQQDPQEPLGGGSNDPAKARGEAREPAPQREREGGASSVDELERSIEESRETDADAEAEPAVPREVQLAAQIERLQSEVDVQRDKWLRAMAESENYRKRARRELESSINLARADVLKQLLEVLDNFERALDAFDQAETPPDETFVKGVRLIQDQFLKVLRDNDVSRIEAVGSPFDPNLHEAVSQMETDEVPSQHVARVVKAGYRLNDMILRPAMVVVAQ